MRDPRMQRWVALTMAMIMRALLTHPQTSEQDFSHSLASQADSFFSNVFASLLRRPSVETANGEKCRGVSSSSHLCASELAMF
jgi:hypothetical protein